MAPSSGSPPVRPGRGLRSLALSASLSLPELSVRPCGLGLAHALPSWPRALLAPLVGCQTAPRPQEPLLGPSPPARCLVKPAALFCTILMSHSMQSLSPVSLQIPNPEAGSVTVLCRAASVRPVWSPSVFNASQLSGSVLVPTFRGLCGVARHTRPGDISWPRTMGVQFEFRSPKCEVRAFFNNRFVKIRFTYV